MKSVIHLIRHGITQGVKEGWFYGSMDIPVIEEGFKEIDEYIKDGIYPKVDVKNTDFYTSGLTRANQTLKYIYGEVAHREIDRLKEINFGEWEGKDYNYLEGLKAWDEWMNDRTGTFRFPGGDTALEFHAKVCEGLDELETFHHAREIVNFKKGIDAESVVVCHGGTIAAVMETIFHEEGKLFFEWTPKTARGYSVEFENGEPTKYRPI